MLRDLEFSPDGGWLASSSLDGTVKLWPLDGDPPPRGRTLIEVNSGCGGLAVSPDGENILLGTIRSGTRFLDVDSGASVNLEGFVHQSWGMAISPDGRLAAAAGGQFLALERVIYVWDIATGNVVSVLEVGEQPSPENLFSHLRAIFCRPARRNCCAGKQKPGTGRLCTKAEDHVSRPLPALIPVRCSWSTAELGNYNSGTTIQLEIDSGAVSHLERFGNDVASRGARPHGNHSRHR